VIVVCDVGQGDAVVLPAGPGQAVVVDAGPEPVATDRCLSRLGVVRVPLLVVSHFHVDHVGGIDGVFRGRAVGAVLTTGFAEPAFGHTAVLNAARAHGAPVSVPTTGAAYGVGETRLAVLGPDHVLSGTRSDPNNNSLVLRATVRERVVLLAGDAETEEQGAVLAAAGTGLRADVIKVAHHGSAYQDDAFLDAVAPAVALVSVGAGNAYGHPNAAVLARLARGGTRVLRTDVSGDLAAVASGDGLAVVVRGPDAGRHPP
jgi:competence protein ComEC